MERTILHDKLDGGRREEAQYGEPGGRDRSRFEKARPEILVARSPGCNNDRWKRLPGYAPLPAWVSVKPDASLRASGLFDYRMVFRKTASGDPTEATCGPWLPLLMAVPLFNVASIF